MTRRDRPAPEIDWAELGRRAFLKQPLEPVSMRKGPVYATIALGLALGLAAGVWEIWEWVAG